MDKEFKKVYALGYSDEDGNTDSVCVVTDKVITDEEKRKEIRERLEEVIPIKEEDEDSDVLADFDKMVENVLNGETGYWLDYEVFWTELDLID